MLKANPAHPRPPIIIIHHASEVILPIVCYMTHPLLPPSVWLFSAPSICPLLPPWPHDISLQISKLKLSFLKITLLRASLNAQITSKSKHATSSYVSCSTSRSAMNQKHSWNLLASPTPHSTYWYMSNRTSMRGHMRRINVQFFPHIHYTKHKSYHQC